MGSAGQARDGSARGQAILVAVASILLLMWPALVNRQPFFFSDTSSYVRAGDVAAHMVFGPAADTVWTALRTAPPPPPKPAATIARPIAAKVLAARGNDPDNGYIMAGRSPYFGLVLWLTWVAGQFWLFVLLQAAAAYFLIALALRCFGLDRPLVKLGIAAGLSLLTPLAIYDGVLLADALSGFGIAAFLILCVPGVRLAGWERVLLILLLTGSVISHLTHLVMLATMIAVVGALVLLRWLDWRAMRGAIAIGIAVCLAGAVSITITSRAVAARYGSAPVLVPLLTARFVADGPGLAYIRSGCGGHDFAVCSIPDRGWTGSTDFLWSRDPKEGAFLVVPADVRRRMSSEDKAFAIAVLRAYPVRVAGLAIWNSVLQVSDLTVGILNERCLARPECIGDQFPAPVMHAIAASPAGRGAWPVQAMNLIVYAAFVAALALLAVALPRLARSDPAAARRLGLWVGLIVVAMLVNGFLGGAISEPQNRYQTRMAWLIPFVAAIAMLALRARPTAAPLRDRVSA